MHKTDRYRTFTPMPCSKCCKSYCRYFRNAHNLCTYCDDLSEKVKLPDTLKRTVWKKYNGILRKGNCHVCDRDINIDWFEVWVDNDANLRLFCEPCFHASFHHKFPPINFLTRFVKKIFA